MKKSLMERIEEMKQLAATLENGASWESQSGYTIDLDYDLFLNLNDDLSYVDEVKFA